MKGERAVPFSIFHSFIGIQFTDSMGVDGEGEINRLRGERSPGLVGENAQEEIEGWVQLSAKLPTLYEGFVNYLFK